MCRGLTRCWSLYGVALILTIALSNAGCCSHRKAVSATKSEATEQVATERREVQNLTSEHAATLREQRERQGVTETEIEIYADPAPGDSTGSAPRLKARIRQRHGEAEQSVTSAGSESRAEAATTTEAAATYEGATHGEESMTAEKEPSLWERMKQGAAWAAAIMILAAAGWTVYKIKKRKTT